MHLAKTAIPAKIDVPGALARQQHGFGDSTGCGTLAGEYFSLGAGTDIAPLLQGLEGDLCQAPHWGYLESGELTVGYADGSEERVDSGDLFYWPPGHTVRAERDSEVILFSPQVEHGEVLEHLRSRLAAVAG